jgi:UDP-glucose 4-epimerase
MPEFLKKVLVTGGAGFLGRHVVKLLENSGHYVRAFDNGEMLCGADGNFAHIPGDVTNFEQLASVALCDPYDAIIHLAALGRNLTCQDNPKLAWDVNVGGTLNVLEIARQNPEKIKRVVVCSSNIVLCPDMTVYKATKVAAELLVKAYARMGVSAVALRPCNIAGDGQSRTEYQPCAFAGMDIAFEKQGHFKITGDGTQTRDFIHAADVARAFELALTKGTPGEAYDVATGKLTSMNEVCAMLGTEPVYVPARPGDAKTIVSDPSKARQDLGFIAEIGMERILRDSFPSVKVKANA